MTTRKALASATAMLLVATACGSGGGNGTMNVHLVDAPSPYDAINLHVVSVEIYSAGTGWVTLGTPDRTIDLLKLHDGVEEVLAKGASLPAGSYGQMRLVLGSGNEVVLSDGTTQPLKVPSGMQSGVKLPVQFDVAEGTTKDVFIDFDAHRSIFLHQAGHSGQYILRPVVRALDKVVTGSVSGTLTDEAGGAPLAGVTVMAETVDASGNVTVVNSATTAADGSYTLGLLPVGASYYVVSQPVTASAVYAPRASGPIAITAAAPIGSYSDAFATVAAPGTLTASVTPVVDADDVVSALQTISAGGVPTTLVVRVENAVVTDTTEAATLASLPPGSYTLVGTRQTVDALGNVTVQASAPVGPVLLPPGGTAAAQIAF